MASTYTVNIGIEKPGTGDQSGTWGVTTNTNFDIIDQATNGVATVTLAAAGTSGSPNTLLINNGALSDGRNRFIEFNDGADLGATAYVQLDPDDAEKIVHIRNSLSASRSLILFQGTYNASNDFEVPNGADVLVKFDGGGAGATVTDVNVNLTPTKVTTGDLDVDNINIDGNTIISTDTNGAINITPNGTGAVNITATTNITGDLDVDNININGNTIISTDTNGNIALTPNGTGEVDISKVDIDSGAIDGTVIGANSAAAITGTTITGTSFVTSGDMTFGDDDKAIFGAGSDLQIYHDGLNSYVRDAGDGNLRLTSDSEIHIAKHNNEYMVRAFADGAVNLYYDGGTYTTPKLATTATGIDVTGTVTADGVTVEGAGVIRLNPSSGDDFLTLTQGGTQAVITADSTAGAGNLLFRTTSAGSDTDTMLLAANGDISFYDSTGVTQGFFWDASAQSLGIGTTSPSSIFHTEENTTGASIVRHKNTSNTSGAHSRLIIQNGGTSGGDALINLDTQASGSRFTLGVDRSASKFVIANADKGSFDGSDEAFVITSGGNVGIGTTSVATNFRQEIVGLAGSNSGPASSGTTQDSSAVMRIRPGGGFTATLDIGQGGGTGSWLQSTDTSNLATNYSLLLNPNGGNVGIGTSSPTASKLQVDGTDGTIARFRTTSGANNTVINITSSDAAGTAGFSVGGDSSFPAMTFENGGSEAMRIDSSGNVSIGITSSDGKLHVHSSSAGTVTAASDANQLVLESTANVGMSFLTGNTSTARIKFGDPDANNSGTISYVHSDDSLRFNAGGAQRVRIDSDGLKFGTDTAAANALNDYEEGTWTPTPDTNVGSPSTFGSSSGSYIKIGNLVTVTGEVSNIDTTGTTGTSQLQIVGLPFTPTTTDYQGAVSANAVTFVGSRTAIICEADASTNTIRFLTFGSGLTRTVVDHQDLTSGTSDFIFSVQYQTF